MKDFKHYILCISAAILFLFATLPASAATLFVELAPKTVAPGSTVVANVLLDTEGELLNAFEGTILFPTDLFVVKELRDGNTLVNVWIEPPREREPGRISFSGITPGGYTGKRGTLLSVVFEAVKEGDGTVSFDKIQLLKNDGEGTPASISLPSVSPSVMVSKEAGSSDVSETPDAEPPEPFPIEVTQDRDVFDGKRVLIFTTQDKISGINYYEVCEGLFAECVRAESPYVLKYQRADRYITVKAVDFYGNERAAVLFTSRAAWRYAFYLIIGILFIAGCVYFVRRMKLRP